MFLKRRIRVRGRVSRSIMCAKWPGPGSNIAINVPALIATPQGPRVLLMGSQTSNIRIPNFSVCYSEMNKINRKA